MEFLKNLENVTAISHNSLDEPIRSIFELQRRLITLEASTLTGDLAIARPSLRAQSSAIRQPAEPIDLDKP